MKQSKLLAETQIDIKIERGLKILEFSTEHNLRKVYYRNCPLNIYNPNAEKLTAKSRPIQIAKHIEMGEIICELNEELLGRESPPRQLSKKEVERQKSNSRMRSQISDSHKSDSSYSVPHESVIKNDLSNCELISELSNYASEASKLKSIKEEQSQEESASIMRSGQQSLLSSAQIQASNLHEVSEGNSSLHSKGKVKKQKVENVSQSSIGNQPKPSPNFTKKESASHSQISNKSSQKQQQLGPKKQPEAKKSQKNVSQSSHSQSKSPLSSKNFLDESIVSRIPQNSSSLQVKSSSNHSNIQFQLLNELSDSFVDRQNIKMLLKLQNCDIEEQYLQRRMVNRLEKGYKQVNNIFNISWDSLKLPRMNYPFNRPNYAHVIE